MMSNLSPQKKTAASLVLVACTMLGLSYAAVPFYDWFCRVTGFGGTTGVAEAAPDQILDQTVLIRFDASTAADMPWEFTPQQLTMSVRLGENGLAFYEAYNPTSRPIAGTASAVSADTRATPRAVSGRKLSSRLFWFTSNASGRTL